MKRLLAALLLGGTTWAALFVWVSSPISADGPGGWDAVRFAGSFVHHATASPDGGYVYAVSSGDATQVRRHLDVSKDGGTSWSRITPSSPPNMVVLSSLDPEDVIAASNTGIYRSVNAGANWIRPTGPLVGFANFRSLARSASNPSVVWAQTQSVGGSSTLLKSGDGGATWGLVSTLTPFHGAVMAIDPKDDLTVYVAAFQRLHKTVDGGLTWSVTLLGGQIDAIAGVSIDPVNPSIVHLSGHPRTMRSNDGGISFSEYGTGYYASVASPKRSGPISASTEGLYLAGADDGTWQAHGVWKRAPAGWEKLPGLEIHTNEVVPTTAAVFAATDGGLYRLGFAPATPPPPTPDTYPVVVIPGIMGSWKDHGVWKLDPISHTYDGLIAALIESGYREGTDLFPFPYEWRASNVDTAELLRLKIDQIQAQTGQAKVNIVAHSMGGLVARQYIQGIHYGGDVHKLILIGTPNLGAPNAYLAWEGEDFSYMDPLQGFVLKKSFQAEAVSNGYLRIFDYVRQRVRSLGELLPIYDYLKDADTDAWRNYPFRYPINPFLENLELNRGQVAARGVQVFSIAGNMGPTSTNGTFSLSHSVNGLWPNGRPEGGFFGGGGIEKTEGDITVPISSAALFGSPSVLIGKHGQLVEMGQAKVLEILGRGALSDIRSPKSTTRFWLLFIHSPVEVSITRSGSVITPDFYTGPDEEPQILSLPDPADGAYEVVATGVGTGSYRIELGMFNGISESGSITAILNGQTVPGEVDRMPVVVSGDLVSEPGSPPSDGAGEPGTDSGISDEAEAQSQARLSMFLSEDTPSKAILAPGSRHNSSGLSAILAVVIFGALIYALGRINRTSN